MAITSAAGVRLKSYLPRLYDDSRVIDALFQADGSEVDQLRTALDEIVDQFFVATATWGLDRWEELLDLPADPSLSEASRRSRILAKLQGIGTATIKAIEALAATFEHGLIYAIQDHPNYTAIVQFVDETGEPDALSTIQAALRDAIPAHLDLTYEFNFFVWSELDAQNWTWNALDALGLTWDELQVYA